MMNRKEVHQEEKVAFAVAAEIDTGSQIYDAGEEIHVTTSDQQLHLGM